MKLALHLLRFGIKPYQLLLMVLAGWVWCATLLKTDTRSQSNLVFACGTLLIGSMMAWAAGAQVSRSPRNHLAFVQPVPYFYRLLVQLIMLVLLIWVQFTFLYIYSTGGFGGFDGIIDFRVLPLLGTCFCLGILGLGGLPSLLHLFWLSLGIIGLLFGLGHEELGFNKPLAATIGVCGCCCLPDSFRERLGTWAHLLIPFVSGCCIVILHTVTQPFAIEATKRSMGANFPPSPIGEGLEMKIVKGSVTEYPTGTRAGLDAPLHQLVSGSELEWSWRSSQDAPWSPPMPAEFQDHAKFLWLFNSLREPIRILAGQIRVSGRWKRQVLIPERGLFSTGGMFLKRFEPHAFDDKLTFLITDVTLSVSVAPAQQNTPEAPLAKSPTKRVLAGYHLLAIPPSNSPASPREFVDLVLRNPKMDLNPYVEKWLPEMLLMLNHANGIGGELTEKLLQAIANGASIDQKEVILKAFQTEPHLMKIVLEKGWESDAPESILSHLDRHEYLRRNRVILKRVIASKDSDVALGAVKILIKNQRAALPWTVLARIPHLHEDIWNENLSENWLVALAAAGHRGAFARTMLNHPARAHGLYLNHTRQRFSIETLQSRVSEALYDPSAGRYFLP